MKIKCQINRNSVFAFAMALALVGCSGEEAKKSNDASVAGGLSPLARPIQDASVVADPLIQNSFAVAQPARALGIDSNSPIQLDRVNIRIARAALEKEFLLQTSMIGQTAAAMGSNLKSRVVAFREREGKVYLLETKMSHVVTDTLPSTLVLAEFEIVNQDSQWITIDFNKGMSHLYVFGDWYASDFSGPSYDYDMAGFINLPLQFNHIAEAYLAQDTQTLVIRQVGQTQVSLVYPAVMPLEIKYYIKPYVMDTSYQPVFSPGFDRYGFFEVPTQLRTDGLEYLYVSRFHPEKEIVFAVSANTPEDYKQPLKDAILYWNKAFGSEKIRVIDAPAGVTAPNPDYNVVQWVEYDQAGFAYADAQMDPRSGQVLHAQAYITSAFAFGSRVRAMRILKNLENQPDALRAVRALRAMSMGSLTPSGLCDYEFHERLQASLEGVLDNAELTDAQILKISQDYVREVTAHEVGHMLGMRHNFAGSLGKSYPLTERDQIFSEYLTNGHARAGIEPSSSVMEYNAFEESVMIGDSIARSEAPALTYDSRVAAILYKGETFADEQIPTFCTDSHLRAGNFLDCAAFDIGSDLAESTAYNRSKLNSLAQSLVYTFVNAKSQAPGRPGTPVQKVVLPEYNAMTERYFQSTALLVSALKGENDLIKIQRRHPVVGPHNKDEVDEEEKLSLMNRVDELGGALVVFPSLDAASLASLKQTFAQTLDKFLVGQTPFGTDYQITAEEKEIILTMGNDYLDGLFQKLVSEDLNQLTSVPVEDGPNVNRYLPAFVDRANKVLLAVSDEADVYEVLHPDNTRSQGRFAESVFPQEERAKAIGLLSSGRTSFPDWAKNERVALGALYKPIVVAALTENFMKVDANKQTFEVRRWIGQNVGFLGTLDPKAVEPPAAVVPPASEAPAPALPAGN